MQQHFSSATIDIFSIFAYLIVFLFFVLIAWIAVLYVIDKNQVQSTLRRNYPVLARLRYFFEGVGVLFRQYFFADDRQEMPFNRAKRSWVYRAAKNVDSTIPFGSSLNIKESGTVLFLPSMYPILEQDAKKSPVVTIGPYCRNPYNTSSVFNISAMSYGAISIPAVKALSHGAKAARIWLNTGEGGLSPYHLEGDADLVFQFGTAKFGVRDKDGNLDNAMLKQIAEHSQVKMFEIKLSQGAKPGKGGLLPGIKVTEEIAKIRGIEQGVDAVSPNRHYDIASVDDLLDMVARVREVTGKPTGFKLAVGDFEFFYELCMQINQRGIESAPDFITIDSCDGGTGAAPLSLIDAMGLPIQETLPVIVDILKQYKLRDRIKLIASGKMINPAEVAWALCAGADFINSARGFLFALGCIQALQCNKNTCPTGITTHNKKLQYGLDPQDKAMRIMHYALNMEKELEIIAHACGVEHPRLLNRQHAKIVDQLGNVVNMDSFYAEKFKRLKETRATE